MSSVDWDLLVRGNVEPSIEQITLAFVINHFSYAFIARRHAEDYLSGCYELPQGILERNEGVITGSRRILYQHFGVALTSIDQFLHTFTYTSAKDKRCRCFVFSVRVQDPFQIKLDRNDHGVWMHMGDLHRWPIITHFAQALIHFWTGESYNSALAHTLIEQAKREDIWRFKVRVALYNNMELLLLKRARRNRTLPLYYELPGKEFTFRNEIDSVIIASVTEQTGWAPTRITGFLGFYDYISQANRTRVREFIYTACAQDKPVHLSEHAYAVWAKDLSNANIHVTPCVELAFQKYFERFFRNCPTSVNVPNPVYFNPFDTAESRQVSQYLDATYELETYGRVNVDVLRNTPLRKRWIPPGLREPLGLED